MIFIVRSIITANVNESFMNIFNIINVDDYQLIRLFRLQERSNCLRKWKIIVINGFCPVMKLAIKRSQSF